MAGPIQRIVLLPRYSALYGDMTFYSVPVKVCDFAQVLLTAWRSTELAPPGLTCNVWLEQSMDLDTDTWASVGATLTPAANTEESSLQSLEMEWIRLVVQVTGAGLGTTAWVIGDFVRRDEVAPA